jgi:hypothetical protein
MYISDSGFMLVILAFFLFGVTSVNTILPNDENANYQFGFIVVSKVNGEKVISLNHFVKLIEESRDQYINILFRSNLRLILDKDKAFQSDKETMKNYGITVKQRLK